MSTNARQDSGFSYRYKIDGHVVIHACVRCQHYVCPFCPKTKERIKYPVTGPVGEKCPLPDYHFPADEEEHRA